MVATLDGLVRNGIGDSEVIDWYKAPDRNPAPSWLGSALWGFVRRRLAARRLGSEMTRRLILDERLVVVLEPGSWEVARRMRHAPRWILHVHWDPSLLLNPELALRDQGAPARYHALLWTRLRWAGLVNRRLLRRAPLVITLTPSHTRILLDLGARVAQIANPVTVSQKTTSMFDSKRPVIGFVGRLAREKGPDVLAQALEKSVLQELDFAILVAGDGPMLAEVRAHVAAIGRDTTFLGWHNDVPAVLAGVDVLVLPSRQEAVPSILIEALAAGCTVVASDAGPGVRDVLDEGRLGRLVPRDDPDALATAIRDALLERREGRGPEPALVERLLEQHSSHRVSRSWSQVLASLVPDRR